MANDLISRQAAIDAVETKIKKWNAVDGEGYHVGLGLRYTDVIDTLTELPSAQPEIIRCKDCEWWEKQKDSLQGRCALMQMYPTGEWFCGNARERRTDE